MKNSRNRRAMMTVYSDIDCPFSHQVRFVIHEKEIDCEIEWLTEGHWPEAVAAANPYGIGPTLFDRDLVLFDTRVIMEYFDERFPHPSLMPADPAGRAQLRLMLQRIFQDWYAVWPALNGKDKSAMNKARKYIREDLIVLSPLFEQSAFLFSNELSLLDCSLAALLWRLPSLGIKMPESAAPIEKYAQRIFARDAFQASLTDTERGKR